MALTIALALGACGTTAPPKPRAVPAPPPPVAAGDACYRQLAARGVIFSPLAQHASIGGCTLTNGVRVEGMAAAMSRPVSLACPTALVVDRWVDEVVQPAAKRHFRRQVAVIHHAGGFACRGTRGGSPSEHAKGRAIDIWGFELDDGTKALIRDHWTGAGARSRFLQEVGRRSCALFNTVLGPGADADHHDHLHLDLGQWKLCQL
ncbi:MAG: extensin family protein [Alphaproteobacteria bacterium]